MAKSIIVRLKKSKHKTQSWTFEIDRPGAPEGETKRQRYVTQTTAKRGALRMLGAEERTFTLCSSYTINGKLRKVTFIIDARKVTRAITNPVK